jgi:regulator of PEP synthase PpsR (kinase-PPPase family)
MWISKKKLDKAMREEREKMFQIEREHEQWVELEKLKKELKKLKKIIKEGY